ncbi:MAG: M1 family aminopeptidase [bacterium]
MTTTKHAVWLSCLILLISVPLNAEESYWQQQVHYTMDVTLIPMEQALVGDQTVVYYNHSPDTLRQFFMHLYPNGYQNAKSLRVQEARRYYQKILNSPEDGGYLKIESFKILNKNDERSDFVLTAFDVNDSILQTDLPEPLAPGDSLIIKLSFYLKVRYFSGRAGYRDFQYDFAQWYPKVCVYDENGWNAQPFHYLGEFYGEFGVFDVTIRTPAAYIVAATGKVAAGDPGWNEVKVDTSFSRQQWQEFTTQRHHWIERTTASGALRSVRFHAERVHDFAWVTSPDFLYETGEWDGIPIHVVYRSRARNSWTKRAVKRAARALEWLSTQFGRYPYPQLTIAHGLLRGGMEYPMLVMNSSTRESLILHEVGHIYFYGILANNEWKEAWLDEGFTSFQTRWYLETRYGKWGYDRPAFLQRANWLNQHRPSKTLRERERDAAVNYINSARNQPISKVSHQFDEPMAYRQNAYTKGAFFFDMLKYLVGEETFSKICQEYFQRWKFKHVNEARFKRVCEDVSGKDLDWFFKQWLHDSLTLDYALGKVEKKEIQDKWHTRVEVLRKHRGVMPVEVQLTTQAGDTLLQRWDGFDESGELTFVTGSKPQKIVVDPNDAILDKTRLNNGPLQFVFAYDYPGMSYQPRHAYLITWRPAFWFNQVDKVRVGGRLKGRYGKSRNLYLGAWFGVDSQQLDGRFSYSNPIMPLGKNTRGTLFIQKMEGRFEIDAHIAFVKGKYLTLPPRHRLWVGFNHSRLLTGEGERYVRRELDQKNDVEVITWEPGKVNNVYVRYQFDPRGLDWYSNLLAGVDLLHDDWGSDFSYSTVFTTFKFWLLKKPAGLYLRFHGKKIFNSDMTPVQDLIFLDGANPRERFKRFFLRSDGALPEELHYHLPGGGNLRGFYNQFFAGDQILAFNVELRKELPPNWAGKRWRAIFGNTGLVLFVDLARMEFSDQNSQFFTDAGLGLRFQKRLADKWYTLLTGSRNIALRFDFPIWVNKPLPDENAVRFRWVFGLEQAF